ncbi:MAG: antibiotic biosynthesis monooxygenase [Coxiellaceae bacterium]|nr:antibiotic biosynthesis monooxygenase [Coxiellaceae bacterium]
MSDHVFVVSEWLAEEGKDKELWGICQKLMTLSRKEGGCIRASATRQISHPGSPGQSKYTIVLLQQYENIKAFDAHCARDYVTRFFNDYIDNPDAGLIADWTCRLFSETEE